MSSALRWWRPFALGLLLLGPDLGRASEVKPQRIEAKGVIQFRVRSTALSAADQTQLDEMARVLIEHPELELIEVEGHTDDREARSWERFGFRRARAVREHLVRRGVAATRLRIRDYGQVRPLESNRTAAGRARNRRVAFRIVTVNGKPNPPGGGAAPIDTPRNLCYFRRASPIAVALPT
jgi:outer membrane protein OmpA-like peptidoglycan-associated protein